MKFQLLYSKKNQDQDTIFLRHRYSFKGEKRDIKIATPFKIKNEYWDSELQEWSQATKIRMPRKAEDKIFNRKVDDFNNDFLEFKNKVATFIEKNPFPTKEDFYNLFFQEHIENAQSNEYPLDMNNFIDFYIEERYKLIPGKQKPITHRTEQKYRTIQYRIKKFFPKIKVTDIDDNFRELYSVLMKKLDYKSSYIIKELKFIKAICHYASKKIQIHPDVAHWRFVNTEDEKYLDPIFSFEELEILRTKDLGRSALDNARDWLLISCYCGQRVSDLLKMSSDNIVQEDFYIVKQQKGQKEVVIYLMPQVKDILAKHNGEFPKKISEQKYNEYIKLVAQACKINAPMKGGKMINNRKVIGIYEKWELVSSHIGRRTFVSLFQPIIGTENIKTQTGHTTDKMVELYNKTLPLDKAKRIKEALSKAAPNSQPPNAYNE